MEDLVQCGLDAAVTAGADYVEVPAQYLDVIREGEFANYLTSRESAAQVGHGTAPAKFCKVAVLGAE